MKTNKVLAVLLAVVLLTVPFAVNAFAASEIVAQPIKTVYTDCEKFNPQGLVISVNGEEIPYTPIDEKFAFAPDLDQYLTVAKNADGEDVIDNSVEVYYDNKYVGSVEITVDHILGDVTLLNQTTHGQYCLGCGAIHNIEAHSVPEFIPNDDGDLFNPQTQTGTCDICKGEVTESIPGSEDFQYIFGDGLSDLGATIVGYFYTIVVSLIQALSGIK